MMDLASEATRIQTMEMRPPAQLGFSILVRRPVRRQIRMSTPPRWQPEQSHFENLTLRTKVRAPSPTLFGWRRVLAWKRPKASCLLQSGTRKGDGRRLPRRDRSRLPRSRVRFTSRLRRVRPRQDQWAASRPRLKRTSRQRSVRPRRWDWPNVPSSRSRSRRRTFKSSWKLRERRIGGG